MGVQRSCLGGGEKEEPAGREDDRVTQALARGQVLGCQCCVRAVGGVGGLVRV